jgi:hypothetical protein
MQLRNQEFLRNGQYWAIKNLIIFYRWTMTSIAGQYFIVSESFSSLKVFFYTTVIFSHFSIPWLKDFNIIADTPNSWLVFSEHFHLSIESEVFGLNCYSRFHSMRFYVFRKVDKGVGMGNEKSPSPHISIAHVD